MDSTKRNLLIIVGADSFPKAGLESHQVFRKSARDFRDYMSQYVSDTLDLFNDERPCLAQVEQIENWLQDKAQDSWDSLFFYYVGHGMVNRNQDFYMAIRDTRRPYDYYSSIQGSALAIALRDWIATKPIAMILDCCFAGAIRNTMGSVEAELNANLSSFVQETKRSARGVVQLCAAGKDFTASALDETANYTMFTGAILHVLRTGMKGLGPRLTLLDLADGARKYIREQFPSQAVDPVTSVSEAIGGESFAAQPFFINNSFRGGAIQTSTSSPVRHASGPAGRRKALSLNTSWRDWFSKDEIRVAVALSQWFRTSEEACEHIFPKCVNEQGSKRDWLACSRQRLYFVVDRPNLVEPLVEWSYPMNCDERLLPRLKLALLSSNTSSYILIVGENRITLSREFLRSEDPIGELRSWLSRAGKIEPPSAGQTQRGKTEIEVLKYLRDFSDYSQGDLSGDILSSLRETLSENAALWAMHIVRMRRRDPRLRRKDTERLRPILDCLCARKSDVRRHRYFSQVAYLLWSDQPGVELERVRLLDTAIKLRRHSPDKHKYERYEAMRAISWMLSDKNFAAGKPSENNISKKIIKDLLVSKSLLEEKSLSDEDNLNIKKWAKLNKSALASSSPDLLHVII